MVSVISLADARERGLLWPRVGGLTGTLSWTWYIASFAPAGVSTWYCSQLGGGIHIGTCARSFLAAWLSTLWRTTCSSKQLIVVRQQTHQCTSEQAPSSVDVDPLTGWCLTGRWRSRRFTYTQPGRSVGPRHTARPRREDHFNKAHSRQAIAASSLHHALCEGTTLCRMGLLLLWVHQLGSYEEMPQLLEQRTALHACGARPPISVGKIGNLGALFRPSWTSTTNRDQEVVEAGKVSQPPYLCSSGASSISRWLAAGQWNHAFYQLNPGSFSYARTCTAMDPSSVCKCYRRRCCSSNSAKHGSCSDAASRRGGTASAEPIPLRRACYSGTSSPEALAQGDLGACMCTFTCQGTMAPRANV